MPDRLKRTGDAPEVLANTSVFPPPPSMYKMFTKQNVAWLAGSATRAQMHVSFGLKNNIGDITAI